MTLQLVSLIVAAIFLVVLFRVLRAGQIREKYAALWIVTGIAVIALAVFPELLATLAGALGVQVGSNLLFFLAILLLLAVSLHLSLAVSRLEAHVRTLAEEVAILRHDVGPAPAARPGPDPLPGQPQPEVAEEHDGR